MRAQDAILAGQAVTNGHAQGGDLAQMLDLLTSQVSDILDMRLYNTKINIKVCATPERLAEIYKGMFHADLQGRKSFYVSGNNTIYASLDSFKREIIGHEIAHAIICNYFPTPAPVKIQEVLSMYVEYNLRRSTK